jgi:hypothetical protein
VTPLRSVVNGWRHSVNRIDLRPSTAAAVEQEMSKNWMGLGAVLSILVIHQKPQPIRPGLSRKPELDPLPSGTGAKWRDRE